tara:strand:+ start:275 stop:568 length:294 start_codon:yes stop_codon:yes gene_type:complete
MKSILSYIFILFLFATSANSIISPQTSFAFAQDIELIEGESGIDKIDGIITSKRARIIRRFNPSYLVFNSTQTSTHEFVSYQGLENQLYILFDSLII